MQTVSILLISALVVPLAACSRTSSPEKSTESIGLDRGCVVAMAANHGGEDGIATLQQDLRDRRAPARAAEQLGYRFISRARLTNDPGFYKVAEQAAACLESIAPAEPAALLLRGHVLHQMHRFGEAEAIARRLVAMREFVLDFGLLGDVLMEQGRVADAAAAYQKMIDLKPFYQSYTRAAHLRWVRGDLPGAIEMMNSAVKSASLRDRESVAWAYSRLAYYELQRGRLADAGRMGRGVAAARSSRHYSTRRLRSRGDQSRCPRTAGRPHSRHFLELGVRHILSGYDHLLFLVGLILATRTVRDVLVALTAFTAAHSLSLALVVIGGIHAPASLVEPLIAASIVWVGLENLVRGASRSRWPLVFGFGLIHGFGFAGALMELGLAKSASETVVGLLSFNMGVEAGQLAVAAFLVPLVCLTRSRRMWHVGVMSTCSMAMVIAGGYWLIDRL